MLLATVGGCSDDPVSLGSTFAIDRSALSAYAAVWEGYAEAHTFASGSDRVVLVLDEEGNGSISFGDAAPRPMPTDADDPFPDLDETGIERLMYDSHHEGFSHDIAEANVEAERLRARTGPTNIYGQAACALQTPVLVEDSDNDNWYSCIPGSSVSHREEGCFLVNLSDPSGGEIEVPCKKVDLCFNRCDCTSTECAARTPGEAIAIDGALDEAGTRLVGSLVGSFETLTVRLTRQP
jgi:hypothetical protein